MANSNLVTSAHAVCYINSVAFARCCGLSYNCLSPKREIHVIDLLQPVELVPTSLSVHGVIQVYKLHNDGGLEAAGLLATWDNLTKEKYFSLMVLDRFSNAILVQVDNCCLTEQSWNIRPKEYILGTASWSGVNYSNDAS